MRIIAPRIDWEEPLPESDVVNIYVCSATGREHCPCFYNEPDPVLVVAWRCCACMKQAILGMRAVA